MTVNPAGPNDSIAAAKKLERGMMVEDPDAEAQCPPPHEMHVVGTAQIGAIEVAVIVSRKRVSPITELLQLIPGRIKCALDPSRVGQVAGARLARGDRRVRRSPGGGDHVPVFAGAVAPLVPT
jgi:hypothetical protein